MIWDVPSSTPESVIHGCAFGAFISGGRLLTARVHEGDSDERELRNVVLSRLDAVMGGEILFSSPERIDALACTPDGKRVAFATHNRIHLGTTDRGSLLRSIEGQFGQVTGLVFGPGAKSLMAMTERGPLLFVDTQSGTIMKQTPRHQRRGVYVAHNGSFLALLGEAIEIWDPSGQTLRVLLYLSPWTGDNAAQWVSYTPEGYFKKSEGTEAFLRWRDGSRTVPFDVHAKTYDHPEMVVKALHPEGQ
jgi:hypothetical protein